MRVYAWALCVAASFAALASGAHDLWAATAVHLALLALGAVFVLRRCWPAGGPGVSRDFLLPLGAVAAAFTVSFARSVHPEESFLALADWLSAMIAFLVALDLFREEAALDALLDGASALVIVEEAVVLYQHYRVAVSPGAPGAFVPLAKDLISQQLPGTLVNASVATAFFLLWAPALGGRVLKDWRAGRRAPPLRVAGFAAAALGVLSLDSNWGMVCLAAGVPLWAGPRPLWERVRKDPRRAAALAAGALAAFAALVAWKFGHTRNMNGQPLPPGETTRRFYWWASALRMFRDHPLSGVGLGNFPSAYLAYKVGDVQNTLYPHNWAAGGLAETGVLGAGAAAAFLAFYGRRLARRWPEVEARWPLLLGVLLFALFGQMGLSVEYLANLLVAALFLGAAAAPAARPGFRPRRSLLLAGAALGLGAVPYLLAPYLASRAAVQARLLLEDGDIDASVRRYADAASMDPRSADARRGWAEALLARYAASRAPADLDDAAARLREAAERDRLSPALRRELAAVEGLRAARYLRLIPP